MHNVEINGRITQLVDIFRRFGMWRIEDNSTDFRKMLRKLMYSIFVVSFVIALLISGLISDDWNESIFLIGGSVSVLVVSVKLNYIIWKREEIDTFLREIGVHSVADYEQCIKVNKKVDNLMKFSCTFFLVTCSVFASIFCLPLFANEKRLPFNIWLPLDWKNNTIVYWIAYAYVLLCTTIALVAATFSILIWNLMMNCALKYQILGSQLKKIFLPKPTMKKRKISREVQENIFFQEFVDLIQTHRNIKKTIHRFKSFFGKLFFIQITTSAITICGSVYVLAFHFLILLLFPTVKRDFDILKQNKKESAKKSAQDVKLIQFMLHTTILFYNVFDIFMVMYLGNEIKLSSDRLSYCFFETNWQERSKSYKMCMIILLEVLKQPHELVIGKLYALNMTTFLSIANVAYSMFNILQNLT